MGDIEGLPFLEAIRQMRLDLGPRRTLFLHVTLVPYIRAAQELKTKPTQHSVKGLREIGIQPDILICRSEVPVSPELREKIALFCNVPTRCVIENPDVRSIYELPLILHRGGLDAIALDLMGLESPREPDLRPWEETVRRIVDAPGRVKIAVCGKYTNLQDAYKSVLEAFVHAGAVNGVQVEIRWVESTELEEHPPAQFLEGVDGILVPGGFGDRGIEGMIRAVEYARLHGVPFLGICLGLHCSAVEFARNVCGMDRANSAEFDEGTPDPVIYLMPEQLAYTTKGGTMRLGAYECRIAPGSRAHDAYGLDQIRERHRHRYEFNNEYKSTLEARGMVFSGVCPENDLVEILELKDHPWFVAVQFHPELRSRPRSPHPLYRAFVAAAVRHRGEAAGGGQGQRT